MTGRRETLTEALVRIAELDDRAQAWLRRFFRRPHRSIRERIERGEAVEGATAELLEAAERFGLIGPDEPGEPLRPPERPEKRPEEIPEREVEPAEQPRRDVPETPEGPLS